MVSIETVRQHYNFMDQFDRAGDQVCSAVAQTLAKINFSRVIPDYPKIAPRRSEIRDHLRWLQTSISKLVLSQIREQIAIYKRELVGRYKLDPKGLHQTLPGNGAIYLTTSLLNDGLGMGQISALSKLRDRLSKTEYKEQVLRHFPQEFRATSLPPLVADGKKTRDTGAREATRYNHLLERSYISQFTAVLSVTETAIKSFSRRPMDTWAAKKAAHARFEKLLNPK